MSTKNELVIVLDRSGSMECIQTDMQGALDRIIKENRADDLKTGQSTKLTLTQFDNVIEGVYERTPLSEVKPVRLEPRGMTALYDAIGWTITRCDAAFAANPPEKVMFVIITDGLENHSREYTAPLIKSMIEAREKEWDWAFTFIGADQDAIYEASKIGISQLASLKYSASAASVEAMEDVLFDKMADIRARRASKFRYSEADRKKVMDAKQKARKSPKR